MTFQLFTNDRGCAVSDNFNIQPRTPLPGANPNTTYMKTWSTQDCSIETGYSRLSIVSFQIAASQGIITNFFLISCIPSYWITPGTLLISNASTKSAPLIRSFTEHKDQATTFRPMVASPYFART